MGRESRQVAALPRELVARPCRRSICAKARRRPGVYTIVPACGNLPHPGTVPGRGSPRLHLTKAKPRLSASPIRRVCRTNDHARSPVSYLWRANRANARCDSLAQRVVLPLSRVRACVDREQGQSRRSDPACDTGPEKADERLVLGPSSFRPIPTNERQHHKKHREEERQGLHGHPRSTDRAGWHVGRQRGGRAQRLARLVLRHTGLPLPRLSSQRLLFAAAMPKIRNTTARASDTPAWGRMDAASRNSPAVTNHKNGRHSHPRAALAGDFFLAGRAVFVREGCGREGTTIPGCRAKRAGAKMLVPAGAGTKTPSVLTVPVPPVVPGAVVCRGLRLATRSVMTPQTSNPATIRPCDQCK
jgi:hypothetical protein